ncbi:MAG: nucleotide sugar dehydrogenase [Actinobacteria bacterium]|nr:nucleotide sugar dehydrogenase [Actinomycetota bacterium]
MKIAVVALGKIGLPLAVQFADKGHEVIGCDVNTHAVDLINKGIEPFPGEAHLAEKLATLVPSGKLRATTDTTSAVAECEAVVVVVPLFVDNDGIPDFGWMDAATEAIAKGLKPGTLVSYETTLPVGTTRTRFGPMIEKISGLVPGKDFPLVFSPERVLTGRVFADLRRYPKLVGGIDVESGTRGVEFYEAVLDFDIRQDLPRSNGVWDLGSAEASEMAKLAETTYRDVNIGLANQFARFAETAGIDIYQVIEASNSQPFSHIHQPGIAVGGHCIPIYPRFYLWNDPAATVVRAAREANVGMPVHAVSLLSTDLGDLKGKKVAVLGISYRGGVKESAFSGVFPTVAELTRLGAIVTVHDPMYTDEEIMKLKFKPHQLGSEVDGVVTQADHAEYRSLSARDFPGVSAIVDGRRIFDQSAFPGVAYRVIGKAQ